MGKKIVANCITTIPGASHIGGTHHGFTGLNAVEKTAAIQRGDPGSLQGQLRPGNICSKENLPRKDAQNGLQAPSMGVADVTDPEKLVGSVDPGPKQLPESAWDPFPCFSALDLTLVVW